MKQTRGATVDDRFSRDFANPRVSDEKPSAAASQDEGPKVWQPYDPTSDEFEPLGEPPLTQPAAEAPKKHTWVKVLLAIIAAVAGYTLVSTLVTLSLLTVGIASCTRSLSDEPVRDTKETMAFIKDPAVTQRDLETFDTLRVSIDDAIYDDEEYSAGELRDSLTGGTWPAEPLGHDDINNPRNPQLWVRLAELAEDELEARTGESWEIMDFAYPFPDNGPIPVPPKRTETSYASTRLICTSGEDAGLCCEVDHYRWSDPVRFEDDLERCREAYEEKRLLLEKVSALDLVSGRRHILDAGFLYLWDEGEDDPLRDPEIFASLVEEVGTLVGDYAHVYLLAQDTPLLLSYEPLSNAYPNKKDSEEVPYETCQQRLLSASVAYWLDTGESEQLLVGNWSSHDDRPVVENLEGTLIEEVQEDPAEDPQDGSQGDLAEETQGVPQEDPQDAPQDEPQEDQQEDS